MNTRQDNNQLNQRVNHTAVRGGDLLRNRGYVRREIADVSHHVVVGGKEPELVQPSKHRQSAQMYSGLVPRLKNAARRVRQEVRRDKLSAIASVFAVVLIVVSSLSPFVEQFLTANRYDLSSVKGLIGSTPADLKGKLQFDGSKSSWVFNKDAAQQLPGMGADAAKVGGVTYSASLPTKLSESSKLTLSDAQNKLDMTMTPQFATSTGKAVDGRVVYPLAGQSQLVYSFAQNGVKEDIVLYESPGDTAEYSYKLSLPDGMEARLQQDGSVGVFGGDPSLFGNISYGSDKDRALVGKVRNHSDKNHLYYSIPAPTITSATTQTVKAQFELAGDELTVRVSGLAKAHYPLSIDPSFVMSQNKCGWQLSNNDDGSIAYGTGASCGISRPALSGGKLSSWAYNNGSSTGLPAAGYYGSAIVNGYMYIIDWQNNGTGATGSTGMYAAKIDNSGVVQTFSSVTAPASLNLASASFVAANGYLYVIGGLNNYTTVNFAKPSATNGTISGWTPTTNMVVNKGTDAGGAAFYNGKIYVVGGCTSIVLSVCNNGDLTHYATVNADGTLSSWSDGPALPTAIYGNVLLANNGFLYSVGGLFAGAGHGGQSAINYAAINSDGSIGAWKSATSLPVGLGGPGAVIVNGYMYVMGGCTAVGSTSACVATTYVAQVYASGRLGSFQQTTSFTTARTTNAIAYNGIVYLVGGMNGIAVTGGATPYQDIQYATISTTPGGLSPNVTSGNAVGSAVWGAATVVYGGYMYLLGGSTPSNTYSSTVYYAKLNSDGSVGTWGTTTSLASIGRYAPMAVAYNGYVYIAGGLTNTSVAYCSANGVGTFECMDIQKAPINANGTLGAWSSAGSNFSTTGRSNGGMAVYSGYVYVFGGDYNNNTTTSAEADWAPINTDGTVGTWSQNTSALGANGWSDFGQAQLGKYLYIVGGRSNGGGGFTNTSVLYTTLSAGGGMSALSSAGTSFTTGRSFLKAGVMGNYLYLAGGGNGNTGTTGNNDIQYIKIDHTTGLLTGSWTTISNAFTTTRQEQQGAIYNGYLYIVGGCNNRGVLGGCNAGGQLADAQYMQIYNSGGGTDADWASLGTLSNSPGGNTAVAANGYLYSMGGCVTFQTVLISTCNNMTNAVYYAPINSDGSIGSWTATNGMVDPNYLGAAVTYAGRIYVMGGCRGTSGATVCNGFSNGVQFATICTGVNTPVAGCTGAGAVSSWQYTYNNTTAASYTSGNGFNGAERWYLSAAVRNDGYVYIAGGANSGTTVTDATQLQYAKINSSTGTMGAWTNANLYTNSRVGATIAINNDYLYVAGGGSSVGSGTLYGDVQFADLGSTGAVGTWQNTTSMIMPISAASMAVDGGYVYVWGGINGSTGTDYVRSDLQYAPIYANGQLGQWVGGRGYGGVASSVGHWGMGGVLYKGYVYSLGGFKYFSGDSGHIRTDNAAYYAPVQTQSQIGRFSMQLATDQQTMPVNFFTVTNKQSTGSSTVTVGFTSATTAAPTYGAPQTTTDPVTATKNALTISGAGANYYWLPIVIDDTDSFSFGETTQTNLSYFQLNYHPNAGMRLRGGKTFNGTVQQSLDAP